MSGLIRLDRGTSSTFGFAQTRTPINATIGPKREAYRLLQAHGYRSWLNGVTMHRPDQPGYDRPDLFVIDDGR